MLAKNTAHMRLVTEAAVQRNLGQRQITAQHHGAGCLKPGFGDPCMGRHARELGEGAQKAQGAGVHHLGQIGNAKRLIEFGGDAVQHACVVCLCGWGSLR